MGVKNPIITIPTGLELKEYPLHRPSEGPLGLLYWGTGLAAQPGGSEMVSGSCNRST